MSLQFIIGGSGAGKTRKLYEDLIKRSMEEPEGRFFAIVPEQFTMQTQKEIVALHPDHGVSNIDIVSFQRLAYRIFEELAVENRVVLDDVGKSLVIRRVVSERKKELGIYQRHLDKPGFIEKLKSMLSEFYQYGIQEEDLLQMEEEAESRILKEKLRDMQVVFGGFKEFIEERYITAEEILDVLCLAIPRSEILKNSVVTLDGFTGFTPVQYRVLEQLMLCCRQVIVTVTADCGDSLYEAGKMQELFHMSRQTVRKLSQLARYYKVELEPDVFLDSLPGWRFLESPGLSFLERHLFRYKPCKPYEEEPKDIRIFRAPNPQREVAFILETISRYVREQGYRYREIAVVTGDLPGYRNELERQFTAHQVPFFLDDKSSVMGNPLVEFVRSAIQMVILDFSYESVFGYVKTGLLHLEPEEVYGLENYVRALGIRGFKRWNNSWEQVYSGGEMINLESLNHCREALMEPVIPFREAMRAKKANVRDMAAGLVHFLQSVGAQETMERLEEELRAAGQPVRAMEYGQVYGLFMELLGRMEGLLGDEVLGLREFLAVLDAGLGEIRVGTIPATVDRVVIGDLTRTRLDHVKVLFLAGANDGIIPSVRERNGILTDLERTFLKERDVDLAPTAKEDGLMQRFYLYLVMTKPSDGLWISYSDMSAAGKGLRPSALVGWMKKLFPKLQTEAVSDAFGYSTVRSGKQRLIEGLREFDRLTDEEEFLELYRWFFVSPEYKEQVRELVDAAFYSYEERGIGRLAAKELYGRILRGSVTRLERYAACAYAHFLNYGLELKERREYRLAAVDMGNLFHGSIDRFFKMMQEENISWRELGEEQRKEMVSRCVKEVASAYGNTIMESSSRNIYLTGRVERMTDRTVWALAEQLRKGDFEPAGFEVEFSAADHLEAMKLPLGEGEALHLRGRIDRLDRLEDEDHIYVKIIDYKSGSARFDLVDLYYGLQLQLVVYMDAAMELEKRKHPEKAVVPAGLFYYNIKDPVVERSEDGDPDSQILKALRMNGLVNSRLEVIRHMDQDIETESDVIPVALKKGLIQETRSSVASEERFDALKGFVKKRLTSFGREILDGEITARPFKRGERTACDYCPYHSVCGFDLKTEGYGYKRLRALKSEAIWEEIEGKEVE